LFDALTILLLCIDVALPKGDYDQTKALLFLTE
jgi:hypothetical protein